LCKLDGKYSEKLEFCYVGLNKCYELELDLELIIIIVELEFKRVYEERVILLKKGDESIVFYD
jgi:hypothetical protein